MSLDLLDMYREFFLKDITHQEGVSVAGRHINNIRYADDTVQLAES